MTTTLRTLAVVGLVVIPGALLVGAAFALARLVGEELRRTEGPHLQRLTRAVAAVRWRDAWRRTLPGARRLRAG